MCRGLSQSDECVDEAVIGCIAVAVEIRERARAGSKIDGDTVKSQTGEGVIDLVRGACATLDTIIAFIPRNWVKVVELPIR